MCYFKLPYSHLPISSSGVVVKTNRLIIILAVKTSGQVATGRGRMGLELPKSHIPRELLLFDLFDSSMETSTHKAFFIGPDLELAH